MLLRALLELRPSRLRARAARRATDAAFDRANGVDTGGKIRPGAMRDVRSENRPHGVQYEATDAGLFGEMIDASGIDPSCYELVDFGSGKGRVLLLASRLPFREVIGVEYSPALHRIAELNLRGALRAGRRSGPVWSVCADAARFPLPDGPLVLYFFNPFGRPVMKRVRDNVVASYGASPRGIVVVYHNPEHADLWEAVGFLERLAWSTEKGRDYAIYAGGPRTQGATTEPNSPTFGKGDSANFACVRFSAPPTKITRMGDASVPLSARYLGELWRHGAGPLPIVNPPRSRRERYEKDRFVVIFGGPGHALGGRGGVGRDRDGYGR